jgi:hypothetical protein
MSESVHAPPPVKQPPQNIRFYMLTVNVVAMLILSGA